MGQLVTKMEQLLIRQLDKEMDLALEIYADQKYVEVIEKTDLHEKMKKIILKHGLVTGKEIDHFTRKINRPELEDIFNHYKGNKDIRNIMEEYGAATIHPIMPHLIYMEFFGVNENLIKQKAHMEQPGATVGRV